MSSAEHSEASGNYWNVKLTRELIEQRYGSAQLELAKHCLRSVNERMNHARYHYQEARAILKADVDGRLGERDTFDVTFSFGDWEGWNALTFPLMKVEANIFAAALAVHSIGDILAHVVYFSLALNRQLGAPDGRDVSLETVRKFLGWTGQYKVIHYQLKALANAPELRPVAKIANHTKHHGLVESVIRVEPSEGSSPYSFEFGAFPGLGEADREIEALIGPAYLRTSEAVVRTGTAINAALAQ